MFYSPVCVNEAVNLIGKWPNLSMQFVDTIDPFVSRSLQAVLRRVLEVFPNISDQRVSSSYDQSIITTTSGVFRNVKVFLVHFRCTFSKVFKFYHNFFTLKLVQHFFTFNESRRKGPHISPVLRQLHWLQSSDESTSNWRALSSRHCLARHLRTWLTTYIWSRKGLDAGSARLPTDRVLSHAHTTHSVTGVSLLPGRVSGTASQQTYVTRTSPTRASGVNLKRIGFLAAGAQCDILLNCAIQIPLLN